MELFQEEEFNIKYPGVTARAQIRSPAGETFQSHRGKHFGMNCIYQKFPIILLKSAGGFSYFEVKRASERRT